jgi:hypothetical protein
MSQSQLFEFLLLNLSIAQCIKMSSISFSLVFCVTLDTKGLFAIEPGMVVVIGAFAGMATRTGHHLAGARIEYFFAYGVIEKTMFPMTFTAYRIDRGFGHCRMIGTVWRMAVVAGICQLVAIFCSIVPFESCFVALAADMTLLAFQQPLIIAGVRGMTGHASVIFVADKMIVG